MAIPQCAIGRVVHDQKRHAVLHAKVNDAHNMRVFEAGDHPRFSQEVFHVGAGKARLEHFDRRLCLEVNMFAEVDIGKTTPS